MFALALDIKTEAACRSYELEVVEEIESGTKRRRPALDHVRQQLNTSRGAVLNCHRLDRIMRGLRDTLTQPGMVGSWFAAIVR